MCFVGPEESVGPRAGGPRRTGLSTLPVTVLASVVWRTESTRGRAHVRLDALAGPEGGLSYGSPPPCAHPPGTLPCDVHLWADPGVTYRRGLAECADVLVSRTPSPPAGARSRVAHLLVRHPGCLTAAVPEPGRGCWVGVRGGSGGIRYARPETGEFTDRAAPLLVASLVHAWVAAGRAPAALRSIGPADA
ncbi:hypothetical protein BM536_006535 [Streptomyces phaeoluteigriseus]|uniref:Uncharacterized protein n=1 Tax=Streptomyces phaeoluteigriseus TaxID=114686 RepID=A0A1V6MX35_9ACTN|nr:hypothetical protein BM536_006535 [Streptomyces phaeoluteigriseus]